jgi:hypothetical protein
MKDVDRRAFLSSAAGLAALGAVASSMPAWAKDASMFPTSPQPESIADLASHGVEGFVAGKLLRTSAEDVVVRAQDREVKRNVKLYLTDGTQVVNRRWDAGWQSLEVGDYVECGTYIGRGGRKYAEYMNPNFMAGWGTIRAISGSDITLDATSNYGDMDGPTYKYRLTCTPTTKMGPFSGGAQRGDVSCWHVGDQVHFTATAASKQARPTAGWALAINQALYDDD